MGRAQPAPPRLGARRRIAKRALEQIDVERQRLHAADQNGVRREVLGGEDVDVGELVAHGPVDGLDVPGRHLVELRPLAEDPVGREARLDAAEVLPRKQIRDPGQPGVRRLADDDVELVLALGQEVPPVADARRDLGVLQRPVVVVGEEARRPVDRRLQLDHLQRPDRVLGDRAGGDARAEADQRHLGRRRALVEQQRQEADHDLRRHVGVVGGVDLAVVLERVGLGVPLVDADRGGGPVFVEHQLGILPDVLAQLPADVLARHRHPEEPGREGDQVPARQHEADERQRDRRRDAPPAGASAAGRATPRTADRRAPDRPAPPRRFRAAAPAWGAPGTPRRTTR